MTCNELINIAGRDYKCERTELEHSHTVTLPDDPTCKTGIIVTWNTYKR